MAVYLFSHLRHKSKNILLILLISNYLNVRIINYKHDSSQIQMFSLSHCFICLVARLGVKLSSAVYLDPTHLGIKVKLFR